MPNWSFTEITIKGTEEIIEKLESYCDEENRLEAAQNGKEILDSTWIGLLFLQNGTKIEGERIFIDEWNKSSETEIDLVLREAWAFHPIFYQALANEFDVEIEFTHIDTEDESLVVPFKIFPQKSNIKLTKTPWDDMEKKELEIEVKRMYSALYSTSKFLRKIMSNNNVDNVPKELRSVGYNLSEKVRQALLIDSKYNSEDLINNYFYYADDLLFGNLLYPLKVEWYICTKCGKQINGIEDLEFEGKARDHFSGLKEPCDGIFRRLTWNDLK